MTLYKLTTSVNELLRMTVYMDVCVLTITVKFVAL